MKAALQAIEYHLPESVLRTGDLIPNDAAECERLDRHTGIHERRVASSGECASDLAVAAAQKLFSSGMATADEIDYLILCTQSPDYHLPTTACLVQERLGIGREAGAIDINLGCSGYVYSLSVAKGLIESNQAQRILLITADTYTRYLRPDDRSTRLIFGDGAAASLITATPGPEEQMGSFCFGTDGRGGRHLIVGGGGSRCPASPVELEMNGAELFHTTIQLVPALVHRVLRSAGKDISHVDLFVLHQPNLYMLEHVRRKLGVPRDNFFISLEKTGNTVSSTIPIGLRNAAAEGRLLPGMNVLMAGWGVGYSWAGGLVRWQGATAAN